MTVVHGPHENHENRQNHEPNDPILRIRRNIKSEGNGMVIRDSRESRDGSINTPAPGKPRECAQRSGEFYLSMGVVANLNRKCQFEPFCDFFVRFGSDNVVR